ncbi:MAG: ABC transporter ATP-binding protein [Planctomycetes bacterium]|nr:ABC transporter ATP-binding protein [Planctomycetota bacterium]
MEATPARDDANDPVTPRVSGRQALNALGRHVWGGVLRNRMLVAVVIGTAALEAFFTKAPFVLVKPLFDEIVPTAREADATAGALDDFGSRFATAFSDFAVWLSAGLGVEFAGDPRGKSVVFACAVVAAVCGILGGLAIYFATLLSRYFATKVVVDLRDQLAAHVLRLPLRFFGRKRLGELISRVTNDTTVLARTFTLVADHALVDPLMILTNIVLVWAFSPALLAVFLPAIPLMALPMLRLGRKVQRRSAGSLQAMGDATESMNQMLSGMKVVKAFGLEDVRLGEFSSNNANYLSRTLRMLRAKARSEAVVFVGYQVGFVGMIVAMGWILLGGERTLGDIGVVLVPISTTYQHIKRIVRVWNTVMESAGAIEGVESILAEPLDRAVVGDGRRVERVEGRVEVEAVSFAYGDDPVVREVSFRVAPGQTVAFVGPSGAGKSTMVDLLMRFHDPQSGRIVIDGVDLRELSLQDYRDHTALVVQQPFLFNTTIGQNIRYGRPSATQAEIEAAARAAQIHDFIVSLPRGYDSIVGERGSNLSGGQMQRVTIARAVLRNPSILFLDEATSALDSENEEAVQKALANLRAGRTSFVIAHRLSTIRDADLILVFDGGRIVESGRHEDLLRKAGLYARLIELQDLR